MARDLVDLKDGDAIEPRHFNVIHAELRRLRRFRVAPPLALSGWEGGGDSPLLALMAPTSAVLVLTTTELTAASGATYGTGEGYLLGDDGTDLASAEVKVKLKNLTDRSVLTNKRILCVPALGSLWFVLPQSCDDLGAAP